MREPDGGGVLKALVRFDGSSDVRDLPWALGREVTVNSVNGSVEVIDGPAIETSRQDGAPPTLGVDITVELPPSFNGTLELMQNNGAVDVRTSASPSRDRMRASAWHEG